MRRLACTILFLLVAGVARAAPATDPEPPPPVEPGPPVLDAALAAGFADHLLATGDPFNALTQYRLARWLEPAHPRTAILGFRIGLCYETGERWGAAETAYVDLATHYAGWRERGLYRAGLAALADHREADALIHFSDLAETDGSEGPYRQLATYARGLALFEQARIADGLDALQTFAEAEPEHPLGARIARAQALGERRVRRTSPAVAGLASLLLPGAGQLLAGHPADAGRAFISAGVLGAWGATLIGHGASREVEWEIGAGVALGTVALFAWASNVLGAVRGAKRANTRRIRRRADAILEVLDDPILERTPDQAFEAR